MRGAAALPSPGDLVRRYSGRARKALGQHFLTDAALLDRIVRLAAIDAGTPVLEVGPGPGGLTVRLLAAGADLVCLDADADMVAHLEGALGGRAGLSIRHGDATSADLDAALGEPPRVVVSNLPYNAAAPILFALLDHDPVPPRMVLMFQLEVARRVVCTGPDRVFGPPGLASNIRYRTRLAMKIPPGAFVPPPKVDSGVVLFERLAEPRCGPDVERAAREVGRVAFGQRRKMLRRSLAPLGVSVDALCETAGVAPTQRPEQLDVDAFVRLGRALIAARSSS